MPSAKRAERPDLIHAIQRATAHLASIQRPDGAVVGEVVWCPMLAAQYVILCHATDRSISAHRRERLLRYFRKQQLADGGYGLHNESHSYLFTTALVYVAIRLLGAEDPRTLAWLEDRDVRAIPSWGKLWLAVAGLYDWSGCHPVTPEMWLLPEWLPVHPRRFYCHTRLIYLGFSYLYGVRFTGPVTPLIQELRGELYPCGYDEIDWPAQRNNLHSGDIFVAPDQVLKAGYAAMAAFEHVAPGPLRRRALAKCLDGILYEERSSNYACISPVNGMLNTLALTHAGHPEAELAFEGLDYWIWDDETDGLRFAGAQSNSWDTAFATQAVAASPAPDEELLQKLTGFLLDAQIREELPDDFARQHRLSVVGGWCFGEPMHKWPVSDCTAEAIGALTAAGHVLDADLLSPIRTHDAVRFILARQNPDGGFGTYEAQRGARVLEHVNPSEMYGNCMTEYSYLECTSSCVQALAEVFPRLSGSLQNDARVAIERGAARIRALQLDDGSWQGIWGINYTYGTWFGVSGLLAAGAPPSDPAVQRACRWVIDHQLPAGGWGESWRSCIEHRYVPHDEPQAVMTSWAMLTLLRAGDRSPEARRALDRGADFLLRRQAPGGEWPRESQAGIFFHTAGLHYELYRVYFPLWALGLYATEQTT